MHCKRLVQVLRSTAILAWVALLLAPSLAFAEPFVAQIVVKLHPNAQVVGAAALSDVDRATIEQSLGVKTRSLSTTRDGAYRLQLEQTMSVDQARAAVNRVRMLNSVLYANVVDPTAETTTASTPAGTALLPVERMIVKFRDPAIQQASARNQVLGGASLARLSDLARQPVANERAMSGGAYVVSLLQALPGDQADALAQTWEADPSVEYAAPDRKRFPMATPNDTLYGKQWDLFEAAGGINMPAAWDITTGSASIVVAVVDTGFLPHPDLLGRYINGYDMVSNKIVANDGDKRDPDASDPGDWIIPSDLPGPRNVFSGCPVDSSSWHGTHVTGTIAAIANNSMGVAGINWVSQVLEVRVLGKCFGFDSDINDGIVWASGGAVPGVPTNTHPARVINLSIGGTSSCDSQLAIDTALANGAVIAVAAGNENADASTSSPGNCGGVITVAATGRSGQRASYSNFGLTVEIAAPGGDGPDGILSTLNTGTDGGNLNLPDPPNLTPAGFDYVYYYGTSMATPHVVGVASLMLSVNPALTPAQVISIIQSTARPFPTGTKRNCTTSLCGAGILDAGAAVAAAAAGAGTPTTTAVVGNPNPSNGRQSVTLTATVTGTTPTGTVSFTQNGAPIANCSNVALTGGGDAPTAACTTTINAIGVFTISAAYSGGGGSAPSSGTLQLTVNGLPTTTTVQGNPNPSASGQNVTFTATVSGTTPTGTVTFTDGTTTIAGCGAVTLTGGGSAPTALCITAALSGGLHTINVAYSGDATHSPTLGSTQQTVNGPPPPTTTKLTSSVNPSHRGQPVMFTAKVTGSNPTGTVAFTDGTTPLIGCGAVPLTGSGNSPTAACTTSTLSPSVHSIKGTYSGDGSNSTSSGQVWQTVKMM